jgi:hypothetical protein
LPGPWLSTPPNVRRLTTITVMVDGHEVKNPVLVTFRVDAKAGKDIRSDDFDGKHALGFTIDAPLIQELAPSDAPSPDLNTDAEQRVAGSFIVLIYPSLIRAGASYTRRFITDGNPSGITHEFGQLADARIRATTSFGEVGLERRRRVKFYWWLAFIVLGLIFLAFGMFETFQVHALHK